MSAVLLSSLASATAPSELLPGAAFAGDVDVDELAYDSRGVTPGALFFCLRGAQTDGHDHAADAVAAGAVALVVERPLDVPVPQVLVPDARVAMAHMAAAFFGAPSRQLAVVGVTGTNGKTTTTHLLRNVMEAAGRRCEVLGTLTGVRTTPEAPDLQRTLATWVSEGVEVVAMEVSSHALELHRVDATRFRVAVFTNLSRDHLDFHGSMEAYFEAKARLFTPELSEQGVVNLDSPYGRLLTDAATVATDTYALAEAEDLRLRASGTTFTWRGRRVTLSLGGAFNVANALAAAHAAAALGVDDDTIVAGLSRPLVVPGRFELVDAGQPFPVVVDYAHTPDGLEQLLVAADDLVGPAPDGGRGRVVVVFGCGGDRDRSKRPAMGEVAAERADVVVVTSDNSRHEDTGAIIEAVTQGFDRTHPRRAADLRIEPDRRTAIALSLEIARPGDVVMVAGKGHETTQDIGGVVTPFDDRIVVAEEWARAEGIT
ncbi:MAG TPA: UDP-N-acetylmuramoyl-L-alanyl-D-glutamate--2,6-diaminopimelate ligase [Acidimicrobiales bacterium]